MDADLLKTPTGRVLAMMVQKKMTIMELKRKIGKDSEIPFDQQRVIDLCWAQHT
jgi:hypothetical protein